MKTLSLLAIVFICGCGSEPVGPTTQLETIPNGLTLHAEGSLI